MNYETPFPENSTMSPPRVRSTVRRMMARLVFAALLIQSLLTAYRWCYYPRIARAFAALARGARASAEGHESLALHNRAVADQLKAAGQEWQSAARTAEYDEQCVVWNRKRIPYYMELSKRYQAASACPWYPFGSDSPRPIP